MTRECIELYMSEGSNQEVRFACMIGGEEGDGTKEIRECSLDVFTPCIYTTHEARPKRLFLWKHFPTTIARALLLIAKGIQKPSSPPPFETLAPFLRRRSQV